MASITAIDEATGRKFYLDDPDDLRDDEELVFLLSLHGGGSVGLCSAINRSVLNLT